MPEPVFPFCTECVGEDIPLRCLRFSDLEFRLGITELAIDVFVHATQCSLLCKARTGRSGAAVSWALVVPAIITTAIGAMPILFTLIMFLERDC